MPRIPLSGTQHALRAGDYEAVVASVGASLRSLTYAGRNLVAPFEADEVRPAYRGATLAPWPNRVVDGAFTFGGEELQLPLTEPKRGHALHGLVSWLDFQAVDKGPSHVTLAATIEPQSGYPWRVVIETTFAINSEGLTQSVRATNESTVDVPFGTGPHPYLVAGEGRVDEWTFELPAAQVLEVTPDRLIPTELLPVDADDPDRFDFRRPRLIGSTELDHAFSGIGRDADGLATVRLTDATGRGVAISWDGSCDWVQVHTADLPGGAAEPTHRWALAVEPMTSAPDAFNSGRGLIVIPPTGSASAQWRINALG